ncbi:sigma-70 family RNA polymerase sigma factor [Paenibacillus ginsengihumi]|uniref:sigma-70 family RNA polymerase sigma factor n=1 Tax=Paenibacillus ginsengihumi TaxID=431596 RepID=UPI000370CA59|nr:sigma-70 family RNA polymerase sigma factor [Paenibacillus ginsengihumi]
MELDTIYQRYKRLLQAIAYRMLGSVADAEDLVHDLFLSLDRVRWEDVDNERAYLVKMTTNRCLNVLKSSRRQREAYIGEWLPELQRVGEGEGEDPADGFEKKETLSYAFVVLLQRLSPLERAVFLLKEALDYDYREIGEMLGKSDVNCRKIFSRARRKVQQERSLAPATATAEQLADAFALAAKTGQFGDFLKLVTEDAVLITDGGGKVRSAIFPILSRRRIAAFLEGVYARGNFFRGELRRVRFGGEQGFLLLKDGKPAKAICFGWDERGERIRAVYVVLNPDKLRHLANERPRTIQD